jgi:hypothetical protein
MFNSEYSTHLIRISRLGRHYRSRSGPHAQLIKLKIVGEARFAQTTTNAAVVQIEIFVVVVVVVVAAVAHRYRWIVLGQ